MDEMRQVGRGLLIGSSGVVAGNTVNTEPLPVIGDPKADQRNIRQVSVCPCLNGYMVNVGCQAVVFRHGQEEELGRELARYLVDPSGVEAGYRKASTEGAVLRRGLA